MVTVRVPATTANMGPCFDTMGMAVGGFYNYVALQEITKGLEITVEGEGKGIIPLDKNNIVYQAVEAVYTRCNKKLRGIKINLKNEIPVARGLGSSAAAIVGGLVAANELLKKPLSIEELLNIAIDFEGHPDNVAPALIGNIILSSKTGGKIIYRQISSSKELYIVLAVPDFYVSTEDARKVLPEKVSVKTAVHNIGHCSLLLWALLNNDFQLMGEMMEGDRLHQPHRKNLVPGMEEVFRAAKKSGAWGSALSGAGPSIVSFCNKNNAEKVGTAMVEAFKFSGIKSNYIVVQPCEKGAEVI